MNRNKTNFIYKNKLILTNGSSLKITAAKTAVVVLSSKTPVKIRISPTKLLEPGIDIFANRNIKHSIYTT